ncbi:flagellar M-ring protein FliF [Candidatus Gastranaerophilus sp. (ex Termes propinquus)]|nr:flagellar M-ring protein FliF [Candidatus Gastranaerophilus sp. (ex Termes propinquus)]
MNDYLRLIANDAKKLWGALDLNQKFTVSALVLVALVTCVYFIVKSTEPDWQVLYSDLADTDIAAISESLKKSGYAYKISLDKKAILVPSNKAEDLRMFVAENSLIQDSSPGFELLDSLQLGSTDFKNKLTKQRIFQGELTRSIERINGITKARVQLAEPERSIFTDNDEEPSASVMLVLEPGYRLKASQVAAIKNLVAYSVPRLKHEKVFLTDQFGNALSDDVSKNSNDMQSFRSSFEKDAAKKIKDTLETIMGKDNVSVQVSADLDFNSTRSTIESYIPAQGASGVVINSQGERETYKNPQAPVVVPTKTTTVILGEDTLEGGTKNTTREEGTVIDKDLTYEKEKTATNYAVTKEIKQVVYAPGSVKRMTVAVAVNKILTESEREEIQNLVAAAGGLDLERGDVINVSSLKFNQGDDSDLLALQEAEREARMANLVDTLLKQVAPLVVFLILGIFALSTVNSLLKRAPVQTVIREPENELGYDPNMFIPERYQEEYELEMEPLFDESIEKKRNEIVDVISSDPSDAARLLTAYMRD